MTIDTDNPSRRTVVASAALGAAALGGIATPAQAQTSGKTFVLVHGAWHGGWCWRRVADMLTAKGHKVFAPTMTGLGERSHLLDAKINLKTHITDMVNVIKWEGLSDIVLVGHSYGGIIISGVADEVQDKISSIVFLDAFVPDSGSSLQETASQPVKDAIAGVLQSGAPGMKPVPAAVFRVNEKDRAWVDAMCTPQPIGTFTDKIVHQGGRDKIAKRAYIRAKGYPSVPFDGALAKLKTTSGWAIHEMTAGHDAMVDDPAGLTNILLQVA